MKRRNRHYSYNRRTHMDLTVVEMAQVVGTLSAARIFDMSHKQVKKMWRQSKEYQQRPRFATLKDRQKSAEYTLLYGGKVTLQHAGTGRLSRSHPALQNIPVRREH